MNDKEVSELRRRLRPDKNNISHIYGCYVNERREILSSFDLPLVSTPAEEVEKYMALLKKGLSGSLGKNLLDLSFSTTQVVEGEEHKLLMTLRNTALKEESARSAFFQKIIGSLAMEGNYLVLIAADTYDIPFRGKDGQGMEDASSEMFSYFLCVLCPVKPTKPGLRYCAEDSGFHSRIADWVVAPPELGFLFPAFDDRSANLYGALYYTKDPAEIHEELIDALFQIEPPMPPAEQKETFRSILGDALEEDCSLEVVQSVHNGITAALEAHKASKQTDPLTFSKYEVRDLLEDAGVPDQRVTAFESRFDEQFGAEAELPPKNLIDARAFELKTPDVVIKVNPARSDLVEARVIDGRHYILVSAEGGVEVNGVPVHIASEAAPL